MRSYFKSALRAFGIGACFMLGLAVIGGTMQVVQSASIPLTCGPAGGRPAGCTPLSQPQNQNDFNNLINTLNGLFSYITMNNANEVGEIQFLSGTAFAANSTVATTLGSVGPSGAHTTVQKWLQVYDSSGNVLYIPTF